MSSASREGRSSPCTRPWTASRAYAWCWPGTRKVPGSWQRGPHRGTGCPGVVCTTAGPGALHALTAAASATSDGVPMLVITAQTGTSLAGRGSLQDSSGGNWSVDTVAAFRSATKLSALVLHPDQTPRLLAHAMRTVRAGRPGAVHLSVPTDFLTKAVSTDTGSCIRTLERLRSASVTEPAQAAVRQMADLLGEAGKGVVLAGQGAKIARATQPLTRLAEQLGWPVATTIKGKSVFPEDHPLSAGVFGFAGSPRAHEVVLDPAVDTLLVLGSALGELSTANWHPGLTAGRRVCRVDIDPLRMDAGFPADIEVVGDAAATLTAVLEVLGTGRPQHGRSPERPTWQPQPAEPHTGGSGLRASAVIASMSRLSPAGTQLFVDNGNCLSWLGQYYVSRPPGAVHVSLNVGSMGYSAGAAVGGSLAAAGRPVMALTGDAAYAMSGMETHTASEEGLPVIWVVLNNGGNAMVQNVQDGVFGHSHGAMYRTPMDAATIGRGLGAHGVTVRTLPHFEAELTSALSATDGPTVIDVRVDASEVPWALKGRIAALRDGTEAS
nr:thiamine pyrophosphate-binding protein [Streptomyces sp. S584]